MNKYYQLIQHSSKQSLCQVLRMSVAAWMALKIKVLALLQNRPYLPRGSAGGGLGGAGAARIIDPLNTTIIAPPKPAIPIAQLPDDQLVTRENIPHA